MNQFPFFVYGTLLPGQPNFDFWQGAIASLRVARFVGGDLYDLGWYPMLVVAPGGVVDGLLVAVEPARYEQVLWGLDFLEGHDPAEPETCDYRRELHIVSLSGGSPMVAWVFVGRVELVAGRPRLATNWVASRLGLPL